MSWCCSSHDHLLVGQLFLARDPRPVRKRLRAPPDPKIAFQPRSAASDQPTSNFLHLLQESNWTPGLLLADKTQRRRLIGRDRGKTTAGRQGRGGRGSTGSLRKGSWRRFVYCAFDNRYKMVDAVNNQIVWILSSQSIKFIVTWVCESYKYQIRNVKLHVDLFSSPEWRKR